MEIRMRLRMIAATVLLPLGLLVACGDKDNGLASGSNGGQNDSSQTTTGRSPSTTSGDNSSNTTTHSSGGQNSAIRDQAINAFTALGLPKADATCLVDAIGIDNLIDIGV